MKFYVIASQPSKTLPFSEAIKWYTKRDYSHVCIQYQDPFTKQVLIAESSRGEHHKITYDNWRIKNKEEMIFEVDVSEELFRVILIHTNNTLQTKYSIKGIIGIILYDIGLHSIANLFSDGKEGVICSESTSFVLKLLGVQFKKPYDFIRTDEVIDKMLELARTEDYIRRIL